MTCTCIYLLTENVPSEKFLTLLNNLIASLSFYSVPPRPTRPPKFDEVAEYEKLKENAALKRRAPGDSSFK